MARFEISKGFEDFEFALSKLESKAVQNRIAKKAIYDGAAPLISEMRAQTRAIPTEKFRFLREGDQMRSISEQEKEQLAESFGVSPIREKDDGWSLKMGFQGYNSFATNTYPKGVPNALIIASVESGSSVRTGYPVVRNTVNHKRQEVIAAMRKTMADEFRDIFSKR